MSYKHVTYGKEKFFFFATLIVLLLLSGADSFPEVEKHPIFVALPVVYAALGYYLKIYEPDRHWFYLWVVFLVLMFCLLNTLQYHAYYIFIFPLVLYCTVAIKPREEIESDLLAAKEHSMESNAEWRQNLTEIFDDIMVGLNTYSAEMLYGHEVYNRDIDSVLEYNPLPIDNTIYGLVISSVTDSEEDWIFEGEEGYRYFIWSIAFGEFGITHPISIIKKTYKIYRWNDIIDKPLELVYTGSYDEDGEDSFYSNYSIRIGSDFLYPPYDIMKPMKEKRGDLMEEELYEILQSLYAAYRKHVASKVPKRDRQWLAYMHNVLTPYDDRGHFYNGAINYIPDYILSNVLRYYPMPQTDRILAVIDTSLFRAAKKGIAISMQGISWSNALYGAKKSAENHFFLSWETLSHKTLTAQSFRIKIDEQHSINLLPNYHLEAEELLELINKLIEGYKEVKT